MKSCLHDSVQALKTDDLRHSMYKYTCGTFRGNSALTLLHMTENLIHRRIFVVHQTSQSYVPTQASIKHQLRIANYELLKSLL